MKLPDLKHGMMLDEECVIVSLAELRTIQREAALWALEEAAKVASKCRSGLSAEAMIHDLAKEIE